MSSTISGTRDSVTERCWCTAAGSESLTVVPSTMEPLRVIMPLAASSASISSVLPGPGVPDQGHVPDSAGVRSRDAGVLIGAARIGAALAARRPH